MDVADRSTQKIATPPPRLLPSLAMLRAFEEFGRHGGIRRAAQQLGVDHAVISRHLRALEALVGTALVKRGSGDRWLTEDGAAYHARITLALWEIGDSTEMLRRRDSKRLLVWSAPGFAFHWLTRRLPQFAAAYPQIEIELRPSDRAADFATNEADADIRYIRYPGGMRAPLSVSASLRAVEIAAPSVFPVCNPEYWRTVASQVRRAADLLDCRLLHEDDDQEWRAWLSAQGVGLEGRPVPGPRLWHAHLSLDAARTGQGIALANVLLLGDDLTTGRLVRVEASGQPLVATPLGGYTLIAREDRWRNLGLVRFRDWLRAEIPEGI